MKIERFGDEKKIIGELFWNILGTKLDMNIASVNIFYPKSTPMFSIIMSVKKNISSITYDDFCELFDMLKRLEMEFVLNDSKQLIITTKNILPLIQELKAINNQNKFNI
jgi:hypothetical protein